MSILPNLNFEFNHSNITSLPLCSYIADAQNLTNEQKEYYYKNGKEFIKKYLTNYSEEKCTCSSDDCQLTFLYKNKNKEESPSDDKLILVKIDVVLGQWENCTPI